MHAVMNHYETAHRISRFGKTTLPVTALPVARLQPIVTPTVPVVPQLDVSEYRDWSSAPSPISTVSSRAPSLSVAEDDAEYDYRRDERMPQTPPANPYSAQRVMIVGDEHPQDSYNAWQQAGGFTQPGYPMQQYQQQLMAQKASDDFAYHQEAASSLASTPDMSPVPSNQLAELGSTVRSMSHVQNFSNTMEPTSEQAHFAVARHPQQQVDFYSPVPDQHFAAQHRAQVARQNSLHVATPTQGAVQSYPALPRSQSYSELPPPSHPYATRPVRAEPVQYAQTQPLAPSPSPPFGQVQYDVQAGHSHQFAPTAARPRNGSVPFPTPIVPPTLYAPRQASYDQSAPGSADASDEEFMGGDEYDDQEMALISHMPQEEFSHGRPPVSSPKKSSKKTKSGRPRNPNRASAAKDPKRAKLVCPNSGCTKVCIARPFPGSDISIDIHSISPALHEPERSQVPYREGNLQLRDSSVIRCWDIGLVGRFM